jgi:glycerophosphoryl diester phosphodiesterase
MRSLKGLAPCLLLLGLTACRDDGDAFVPGAEFRPANEIVRQRILALAPAANLGHRGLGATRLGSEFPENSIAAFTEAMARGAHGVELDVELTADGKLVVMHDDTVTRTTTCTGCVSAWTFDEVRQCRLLDGNRTPTSEAPPTLEEVYAALPPSALVNVELKVFDDPCATATTGAEALARAAVDEVRRLGVAGRTLFSSFDEDAAAAVKDAGFDLYSALLFNGIRQTSIDAALRLQQDAIHPLVFSRPADLLAARDAGLQVNVWAANDESQMRGAIAAGATAIITDEPALLAEVRETLR